MSRNRIWNIGVFSEKKKNLSQENERFHYSSRFKSKIFASIKVKKFPSSSSIEKAKPWLFLSLSFPLQPWLEDGSRVEKRWKIRYIRSRRRLASGCEFLECRSIQPCGTPFFSFCPFSYFAPPFLAPPLLLQTQPKLSWTLFFTAFSLSLSLKYPPVFSLPRKIRPLSSVNSFDFYLGRWFSGSSVPRFEDFINIKPRAGEGGKIPRCSLLFIFPFWDG